MPQYLVQAENIRNGRFLAGPEESFHISRAVRARAGDEIEIFDGAGGRWVAVIESADPAAVSGTIKAALPSSEYKLKLTLCLAVTAKAALESAVERCTAAGVAVFQPVITSRVQFDLFADWERRRARLEQVALAACKQCGRSRLPDLLPPVKWDEFFSGPGPFIVAAGGGLPADQAAAALAGADSARLFVGPEGGFTRGELNYASAKGAVFLDLGLHVLRAEDAAFAASLALLTRAS